MTISVPRFSALRRLSQALSGLLRRAPARKPAKRPVRRPAPPKPEPARSVPQETTQDKAPATSRESLKAERVQ
ncbi:MAG: hypothetical protein K0U98_11975 [Deltaproteobacteria bacterium]|nr:hypothetical protein [Deltaproteobacteria bacterium]